MVLRVMSEHRSLGVKVTYMGFKEKGFGALAGR